MYVFFQDGIELGLHGRFQAGLVAFRRQDVIAPGVHNSLAISRCVRIASIVTTASLSKINPNNFGMVVISLDYASVAT